MCAQGWGDFCRHCVDRLRNVSLPLPMHSGQVGFTAIAALVDDKRRSSTRHRRRGPLGGARRLSVRLRERFEELIRRGRVVDVPARVRGMGRCRDADEPGKRFLPRRAAVRDSLATNLICEPLSHASPCVCVLPRLALSRTFHGPTTVELKHEPQAPNPLRLKGQLRHLTRLQRPTTAARPRAARAQIARAQIARSHHALARNAAGLGVRTNIEARNASATPAPIRSTARWTAVRSQTDNPPPPVRSTCRPPGRRQTRIAEVGSHLPWPDLTKPDLA